MKTATEIDEIKRLKAEVRQLKERLTDEVLDHKIDEVALRIACRNLGTTPDELKNGDHSIGHHKVSDLFNVKFKTTDGRELTVSKYIQEIENRNCCTTEEVK